MTGRGGLTVPPDDRHERSLRGLPRSINGPHKTAIVADTERGGTASTKSENSMPSALGRAVFFLSFCSIPLTSTRRLWSGRSPARIEGARARPSGQGAPRPLSFAGLSRKASAPSVTPRRQFAPAAAFLFTARFEEVGYPATVSPFGDQTVAFYLLGAQKASTVDTQALSPSLVYTNPDEHELLRLPRRLEEMSRPLLNLVG